MKYKAVLFDMDDTLINSGHVYDKALRFSSNFLAKKYDLDPEVFYNLAYEKHNIISRNFPSVHTRHSRILLFRMALDESVKDYDIGILPDVEDMYWDYFLDNVEVYRNVKSTLTLLRKAGMRVAIVSDGDLSLRIRKAKKVGLLKYVDELVASEEVIFEKPFSAIFTLALSRLKVEPEDAVMIGNDYKNDIRGAQLVGIKAGVFIPKIMANTLNQDGSVLPDFIFADYRDLPAELGVNPKEYE